MIFIRNYSFDFLHGGKNSNFTLSEKDSNQNSVICFLRQNPDAPKGRKIFLSNLSIFNLLLLYNYRIGFFQQIIN